MLNCVDHGKRGNKAGYASSNGVRLHRLVYCTHAGVSLVSIKGLMVLHACDNARCINPEHLRLGSHQDNMDDRRIRRRGGRATAKIDFNTAEAIRTAYATGSYTQRELAAQHGVGQYIISRVVNNKLWTYA